MDRGTDMSKQTCEKCGKEMIKKVISSNHIPAVYADSTALSTITTTSSAGPPTIASSGPTRIFIRVAIFVCPDCGWEKQARDIDND